MSPTPLELLAPARNADIAIEAIKHGADAIYIGAPAFGARAAATNSIDDIKRAVDYAHPFGVKIYVTLNTILYDNELDEVQQIVNQLYSIGVDGLIVQDMAYLKLDLPPIALHSSTQCDTRTPDKAQRLEQSGFSQIVLARELSLEEIRQIKAVTTVPLEGFVHGALCVSYSGNCQASQLATGRSANRGECAQMCRLAYDLTDKTGKVIKQGQHLLSLRDMNRIDRLAELADAGISSFKIEGRLKDVNYVKNIVAAYRIALDQVIAQSEGRYCRASVGRSEFTFTPEPDKSFNRGFTDYFLNGRPAPGVRMGNHATPKWVGTEVGTVLTASPQVITAQLSATLANGDGIGYFDKQGQFTGFRLNKVDGRKLFPASPVDIEPGTTLYRNNDKQWEDKMQGKTATRTIAVNFTLRNIDSKRIALDAEDQRGNRITATIDSDFAEANTPQEANRQRNLAKLGATIYRLDQLTDILGNRFVAASVITELRRHATDLLDSAQRATYKYDRRRQSQLTDKTFDGLTLTYHDNVSNRLAFDFYKSHGAKIKEKAIEVDAPSRYKDVVVMTTRYCLRRELGACLKTPQAKQLPNDLQLRAPAGIFRLEFDCRNCEMHVIRQGEKQNK
jgi:putative protease